ncbi:MAG: putative sugar O-methyltransferase [Rhodospirillales bacterium]|nr:putative sugar O-methyltransferase [Rhodospirillales bacterium]
MSAKPDVPQLADDRALLELMMADLAKADALYRPTSYWAYYESRVADELRRLGLEDFRRRRDSWGASFGSVEVMPEPLALQLDGIRLLGNKYTRRIPGWRDFLAAAGRALSRGLAALPHRMPFDGSLLDTQLLTWEYVRAQAREFGGRPLEDIGASLAGNPGDAFRVGARWYTMQFLKFYWRYAWSAQWVPYDEAGTIVELGSGTGAQAEIFHKLYPRAALLLFDLPPQLYVAERYLATVFPDDVVSFREARGWADPNGIRPGKIHFFGSWQFPLVARIPVDLFWNARSLGETEPEVAANYLSFVARSSRFVYLNQLLGGGQTLRSGQGPGVARRTLWADYERALEGYELLGRRPSLYPSRPSSVLREHNSYADEAVWRRR